MTTYPSRLLIGALSVTAAILTSCSSHTAAPPATPPDATAVVDASTSAAASTTTEQTGPIGEPVQPAGNTTAIPAGGLVPAVNTEDPAAVAVAAVTTMNRSDTAIDRSPLDAVRRAGRWFVPALLADSLDVPERGDSAWTVLSRHNGYTAVDHIELANETGQPANTPTNAYVQISYQLHDVGRDGWQSTPTTQLSRVQLVRAGQGAWLVSGFRS